MALYNQQKIHWGIGLVVFLSAVFLSYYFSHPTCAAGLVPCTNDCNLCYLIVGISNIVQYLTGALLTAAFLLGLTIAGLSYMVSGAFPKALNFAKQSFEYSIKGFILALIAWLIINGVMNIVGYKHPLGGKWWQFECSTGGTNNNGGKKSDDKCDSKNKKLESITIQCAEQKEAIADNGSGFYVVLDTLSEDGKGKTKQLKAVGKYSCDGTTSEEDITSQVEWKASDETQIKVSKGLVEAVENSAGPSTDSVPYIEASYQGKGSNQAKVYIDACPNTQVANTDTGTNAKFSFSENSLIIPKAHAQSGSSGNYPQISQPASEGAADCKSCGQANTCPFIYGNENAPRKLILIRASEVSDCDDYTTDSKGVRTKTASSGKWNRQDKNEYETFKSAAGTLSKGIDFAPDGKNNFAVYRSDSIAFSNGYQDSNCPKGNFVSYGYICNNVKRAYSRPMSSVIAVYSIKAISSYVLAHEQIGHNFGKLDDEYTECGKDPNNFSHMPHYNCTDPSKVDQRASFDKVTKWGKFMNGLYTGCSYSEKYFRPSYNSIMNSEGFLYSSFDSVNDEVIKEKYAAYPNGADKWKESLSAQCSVK